MGVPDLHRRHLGELGHRLPVGAHRGECGVARVGPAEAVVPGRDREARRHPLQVVLEWPGQRLVEVVQVEQQLPLGGREHPEVRQMGVAAELNLQAGPGRVLQVGGHDLGRAPVEGERGDHHAAVADRHEVRLAGRVLLLEQCDRVGTVRCRFPARVRRARHMLTRSSPCRSTFVDARVRNRAHRFRTSFDWDLFPPLTINGPAPHWRSPSCGARPPLLQACTDPGGLVTRRGRAVRPLVCRGIARAAGRSH